MNAQRSESSHSLLVLGLIALAVGCGGTESDNDPDGRGGSGNSGATGGMGMASGGASAGGPPGSGGSGGLVGGGGSSTGGAGAGGANATGGSGATAGSSGSAGAPPTEEFPTGFGAAETVIGGLTTPARIGFHDGYLYFTELGTPELTHSRLARMSPSGEVETILAGQDVGGMFLDEEELFVSERGTRKVFRVPYATLTPELFVEAELMVADIERIGERIWMTLFNGDSPRSTGAFGLDRTTKQRTELVPVVTGGSFLLTYMSASGDNLYISSLPFDTTSSSYGLFKRGATQGGLSIPGIWAQHTSTDASYVYFSDQATGMIFRQAHTADNQPEVLATGQVEPFAVQVAPEAIYFSNSPGCVPENPTLGSVQALPLDGGTPVPVASNEPCPGSIATDADYVYWTRTVSTDGPEDDSIMRARKLR